MASFWNVLLDDELVQEVVVTDPVGSGSLSAFLDWPPGGQLELTELFRTCVKELWSCLDALVVESVESFSVLNRVRNSDRRRFFPMADSDEGFQALLEESCMDGALRTHVAMVEECQPFQGVESDSHEIVRWLRRGLKLLLEWDTALESGALMGAWATPVEPQVHVEAPVLVEGIEPEAPGPLVDEERVLARFQLGSYTPDCDVFAQAGTYIDLCFTPGFVPADDEDTFERRLRLVLAVVTRFAGSFALLSHEVPGSRRVLPPDTGTSETWIHAAQSSRRWSEQELAALAQSDIGLGRVEDAETLTLIVNTPDGVYERVIPNATPLRIHERRGAAAEIAVQDAVATWGLPDFVMRPSVERKGSGVREISDGLLVVGNRGIVVQSKAREVEPGTYEREKSWAVKQITAASKQIDGTIRRLRSDGAQMVNGRNRSVYIDGPAIDWVGVVIIEHPAPPREVAVPAHLGRSPIIALLRRDWEFLFDQLRSTYAVVQYLHRVRISVPVLGDEPERYYEFAAADAAASPGLVDPSLLRRGSELWSMPLLPSAPAGSDDHEAHTMFRIMLEDIATSEFGPDRVEDWQRILASVDSLPVGHRTELGRLLLDALSTIAQAESGFSLWKMRTFLGGPDADQLGFVVCSALTDETRAGLSAWVRLRHHERGESTDINTLTSVGVLLTPRADGDWDTTVMMIQGDPELTDDELRSFRALWNKPQSNLFRGT